MASATSSRRSSDEETYSSDDRTAGDDSTSRMTSCTNTPKTEDTQQELSPIAERSDSSHSTSSAASQNNDDRVLVNETKDAHNPVVASGDAERVVNVPTEHVFPVGSRILNTSTMDANLVESKTVGEVVVMSEPAGQPYVAYRRLISSKEGPFLQSPRQQVQSTPLNNQMCVTGVVDNHPTNLDTVRTKSSLPSVTEIPATKIVHHNGPQQLVTSYTVPQSQPASEFYANGLLPATRTTTPTAGGLPDWYPHLHQQQQAGGPRTFKPSTIIATHQQQPNSMMGAATSTAYSAPVAENRQPSAVRKPSSIVGNSNPKPSSPSYPWNVQLLQPPTNQTAAPNHHLALPRHVSKSEEPPRLYHHHHHHHPHHRASVARSVQHDPNHTTTRLLSAAQQHPNQLRRPTATTIKTVNTTPTKRGSTLSSVARSAINNIGAKGRRSTFRPVVNKKRMGGCCGC